MLAQRQFWNGLVGDGARPKVRTVDFEKVAAAMEHAADLTGCFRPKARGPA